MLGFTSLLLVSALWLGATAGPQDALVQYGTMHEAIGQGQHHGRVPLGEIVARPHFFGVAALESLAGEVTIFDGNVTITGVDEAGKLAARTSQAGSQVTLLAGAYVASWSDHPTKDGVPSSDFDATIARIATARGLDTSRPFVFTIEGELTQLGYHVINGSCPRQAAQRRDLPPEQQPLAGTLDRVHGRLVGLYAENAAGKLTHPDTSTHVHVLFEDTATGQTVTAHVDHVGAGRRRRAAPTELTLHLTGATTRDRLLSAFDRTTGRDGGEHAATYSRALAEPAPRFNARP